jgi:hypothetical protein
MVARCLLLISLGLVPPPGWCCLVPSASCGQAKEAAPAPRPCCCCGETEQPAKDGPPAPADRPAPCQDCSCQPDAATKPAAEPFALDLPALPLDLPAVEAPGLAFGALPFTAAPPPTPPLNVLNCVWLC